MYKPRKPNDVPYFTTEIVATSSSSSSPTKKPSGSAAKKHVASCKPGFQPSAAAHSMAVSSSFRVIPRIWYCGVVVVISRKSEYGTSFLFKSSRRPCCYGPFNLELGERSADRIEVTVPTEAVLVAARTRNTILDQRFAPVVPFLDQRLAYAKSATLHSGASIGTNTNLREPRNLARHLFRLLAGTTLRSDVFAQANVQALLRRYFSSGEDNLQCAALANDSRQADCPSVNQRHTPTATIDAEVRIFRHHPKIAP